jgi:hypothetical protein
MGFDHTHENRTPHSVDVSGGGRNSAMSRRMSANGFLGVGEPLAPRGAEAERVVQFAVGEQPSIGGDDRTAKLEREPAVEIEPQDIPNRLHPLSRFDRTGRRLVIVILFSGLIRRTEYGGQISGEGEGR